MLHKESDIANNYETEFSALEGFVVSELSSLKDLTDEVFLKLNEQQVKELASLREANLNKTSIIKTLLEDFC